eukprot:13118-Heterococcus_DN1.PRE.1
MAALAHVRKQRQQQQQQQQQQSTHVVLTIVSVVSSIPQHALLTNILTVNIACTHNDSNATAIAV